MSRFKSGVASARRRILWLALAVLPLIIAACNNGSGGSGY
jgi:hypothetical protein